MERNTIELIQCCLLSAAALSFFVMMVLIMITCAVTIPEGNSKEFKKSLLLIAICGATSLFCGVSTFLLNFLI